MKLHLIDFLIIATYLPATVFIGLYYRKQARQDKDSYLLGGRTLPWYKLELSDASGMFDISGTMWMVSLCFVGLVRWAAPARAPTRRPSPRRPCSLLPHRAALGRLRAGAGGGADPGPNRNFGRNACNIGLSIIT